MRFRKITNRGGHKQIGKFPSIKTGQTIMWESLLERDFIYWLEFFSDVTSYREQPLQINYLLEGKPHHYTPDFLAICKQGRIIYEVKYEEDAAKEENQLKFALVDRICRQNDYEFKVVTETAIRRQPQLDNIKFLFRYAGVQPEIQHQFLVRDYLANHMEVCLAELTTLFQEKRIHGQFLYALLYRGVVSVNLSEKIGSSSRVQYGGTK